MTRQLDPTRFTPIELHGEAKSMYTEKSYYLGMLDGLIYGVLYIEIIANIGYIAAF